MTVEESNKVKGIAVLLMFWTHLFTGSYLILPTSRWFSLLGQAAMNKIAYAGTVCLFMFIFCSGYGLYRSSFLKPADWRKDLRRIFGILVPYWLIMDATILWLAAHHRFEPRVFLINLFALSHNDESLYVTFSWFIKVYLELLILLPLMRAAERKNGRNPLKDFLLYIALPAALQLFLQRKMPAYEGQRMVYYGLYTVNEFVTVLPSFYAGVLCAKYQVFEKLKARFASAPSWPVTLAALAVFAGMLLVRQAVPMLSFGCLDWAEVILLVCCLLLIFGHAPFHSRRALPYLGSRSLHYWLLSGSFFLNTSELQFIVYLPQYVPLVVLWEAVVETPFVMFFDWASRQILAIPEKLALRRQARSAENSR